MKFVDLGEPTSFLDHAYLGCIQFECKNLTNFFLGGEQKDVRNYVAGAIKQSFGRKERLENVQSMFTECQKTCTRDDLTFFGQ